MHFDDAWIEAELERQLQEMGPVSDDESEEAAADVFLTATSAAEPELVDSDLSNVEQSPFNALPSSFHEMLQGFQDWEAAVVANTENEIQELREAVEQTENQLHKPLVPLKIDELETEEGEACGSTMENFKFERTWWRWSVCLVSAAAEQKTDINEITCNSDDAPQHQLVSDEHLVCNAVANNAAVPSSFSHREESTSVLRPMENVEAQFGKLDAASSTLEFSKKVEEQQNHVEVERVATLIALEKERVSKSKRLAEEEEERRQEEERCREEMAMYSEELRLQEFRQYRKSCKRREWRCFAAEDRRSGRMRNEERKQQELESERLLREMREREATERCAMAREDATAGRLRDSEREEREMRLMYLADIASNSLREEEWMRREWQQMVRLDLEARQWREEEHVSWELQHMLVEDKLSMFLRNSCSALGMAKAKPKHIIRDPALRMPTRPSNQTSSAILASLLTPPACSRRAHTEPQQVTKISTTHDPQNITFGTRMQANCCVVIDPWAAMDSAGTTTGTRSRRPSSHGRASVSRSGCDRGPAKGTNAGLHDNVDQLCSGPLCKALKDGIEHWQKLQVAWRRPPAATASNAPQGNSKPSKSSRSLSPSSVSMGNLKCMTSVESHEYELQEAGIDDIDGLIKFEIREERLEHVPKWLPHAVHLRILNLTGNWLKNLEPLCDCVSLEELLLCQNALTSLRGLRRLDQLVVLRATANKICDSSDLSELRSLRIISLSMNKLEMVQWRCSALAKLELYGNALVSVTFLENLPSLTFLDLGRNQLTCLDARLSEWNPLLIKLYLYENRISSLPHLRLPLLTDLVLNKNLIQSLGPLGFLPALERLQAKENKIGSLASPITTSPLLQMLSLTDNLLQSTKALQAIFEFPRLKQLHLNDNPVVAELMEKYRPWVLEQAPYLLELDNGLFTDQEKRSATIRHAIKNPFFSFNLADSCAEVHGHIPCRQEGPKRTQDWGLLSLTDLVEVTDEDESEEQATAPGISLPSPIADLTHNSGCAFQAAEIVQATHQNALAHWKDAFEGSTRAPELGGCMACGMALWCESLLSTRTSHMAANLREERIFAARGKRGSSKGDLLLYLRQRRDFWDFFVDICYRHYEDLLHSKGCCAQACRVGSFDVWGAEQFKHRAVRKLQARWRGILSRRQSSHLRFQRRCQTISPDQIRGLLRVQALVRGASARQVLRGGGMRLPVDKLREQKSMVKHRAAVRVQSAYRGLRGRRQVVSLRRDVEQQRKKLEWAREMSKVREEDDDIADIDVGQFLKDLNVQALGEANAFALHVPEPVARTKCSMATSSSMNLPPVPSADAARRQGQAHPLTAWGTPPTTATDLRVSTSPLAAGESPAGSAMSTPGSKAGDTLPRRSRSLSSTAESAITESEGILGGSHDEWKAKAMYDARRKRERPPGLPKVSQTASLSTPTARTGISRGGSLGGRGNASGRGGGRRIVQSTSSDSKGDKKVLKAQDQIANFFKSQQQESTGRSSPQTSLGRSSPDPEALEFSSGPLNRVLLRNAMQSPPHTSSSPRARSPRRLST